MSVYQTPSTALHQLPASPHTPLPSRAASATTSTAITATGYPQPTTPDIKLDTNRPRIRLPPTIEPALVPQAQLAKQSFSQALAADHSAALQPDYHTSFRSANDIVKRLLPYHVWHVNEEDLRWTLNSASVDRQGSSTSSHKSSPAKRSRDKLDIEEEIFPTNEESFALFSRHYSLQARARKLRYALTGGTSGIEGTLFYQESLYNIEKLAVEQERELLNAEHEKLRQAKEKAIEMGVSWDTLMRLGPSLPQGAATSNQMGFSVAGAGMMTPINGFSSTSSYQKSVGGPLYGGTTAIAGRMTPTSQGIASGTNSLPGTPTNLNTKPRGRPRKTRDQDGKIIQTPPAIKPAVDLQQQQQQYKSNAKFNSSSTANNNLLKPQRPPTVTVTTKPPVSIASPLPSQTTTSPATTIPSHPIPLVLPLSTLATLSSLGIAPVPAPHLLPAISAQQAQKQSQGQSSTTPLPIPTIPAPVHSTAPRPAPLNQQEPALLMGITEAPLPRKLESDQSNHHATQQMLHVSVVLSKLSPSQLSGLANLMQSLQQSNVGSNSSNNASSSSSSAATAGTTTKAAPR